MSLSLKLEGCRNFQQTEAPTSSRASIFFSFVISGRWLRKKYATIDESPFLLATSKGVNP